jgi:hypothetical protein
MLHTMLPDSALESGCELKLISSNRHDVGGMRRISRYGAKQSVIKQMKGVVARCEDAAFKSDICGNARRKGLLTTFFIESALHVSHVCALSCFSISNFIVLHLCHNTIFTL